MTTYEVCVGQHLVDTDSESMWHQPVWYARVYEIVKVERVGDYVTGSSGKLIAERSNMPTEAVARDWVAGAINKAVRVRELRKYSFTVEA